MNYLVFISVKYFPEFFLNLFFRFLLTITFSILGCYNHVELVYNTGSLALVTFNYTLAKAFLHKTIFSGGATLCSKAALFN